ncbi:methyltransferase family protein [Myxococcus faecalis]|uniref:methyltransferase family protein n=1 Tax=Myxococcus faecalis TaxID=3115646 RepID=UPI003CF11E9E
MRALFLPPVVLLASMSLMVLLHRTAPLLELWGPPSRWLGGALVLGGIVVAQWHARLFKRLGTNINTFEEPGTLTREGLFRFTRNPMYLGFVTSLLGLAIALGSASPFLILAAFVLLTHFWYIRVEEQALLRKFGARYVEYRRAVRRWL